MQGAVQAIRSHGNVLKNVVLQHVRILNPAMRPMIFSRSESVSSARLEEHGFESTTISDILKGKGKSADGSWLWCTTEDTVYDAVKSMTQHNVGALVVVKPGEEKAIAGIITERVSGCHPFSLSSRRSFSVTTSQLPPITDPDIETAFKDLMAMSWDEIPNSVVNETKKALSKTTDDKAGQEALANVFRAAEAAVEFGGVLVSLRMALDDLGGLTGENVGRLPDYLEDALKSAYKRYMTYLDSFGPDETYLRKKVETELGTKMIHLKMRCSGIGSEWGKITLLGTSGISGSYVEQRA